MINTETLKTALENTHFQQSRFFPNEGMFSDKEYNALVVECYKLYQQHHQELLEIVFNPSSITEEQIFEGDTLSKIAQSRRVCKTWEQACDSRLERVWKQAQQIPSLKPIAEQINGQNHASCLEKFRSLSSAICPESVAKNKGPTFNTIPFTAKQIEQFQKDKALQIVWNKDLRQQVLNAGAVHVPDLDASAHDIRLFLQNCNVLGQIAVLDLTDCGLSIIPEEVELLGGLQDLDLGRNQIREVPNFTHLPQLRELYLNNNQIREVPNFTHLPQLRELYLNNNQIREIPNFTNLPQLEILRLSNNQIKEIPNFTNLPQLETLRLSHNQITEVPNFTHLPQLQGLYLANNKITEVPNFTHLPQLRELINL